MKFAAEIAELSRDQIEGIFWRNAATTLGNRSFDGIIKNQSLPTSSWNQDGRAVLGQAVSLEYFGEFVSEPVDVIDAPRSPKIQRQVTYSCQDVARVTE